MLSVWAAVFLFFIIGVIFAAGGIITSFAIHPRYPSPVKTETYECGPETVGPVKIRFRASYFMYALIFVIFDVETVFLYPWAVRFKSLGFFAFVEMIIFIFILVLGLWYAWKEGALEWM
ncbi:MAG TPA: NADH-quinone oxidoreductase subunit A [Spirochaetia bacterium]|nr:NADH-quinone oxidoreductase subunit A [Spirochaetia bacterium]